jgi:hypothetical protein
MRHEIVLRQSEGGAEKPATSSRPKISPLLSASLLSASLVLSLCATQSAARELSFEERVAAQRAIEQVYWNHRVWPRENPAPKPPLSAVLGDGAIRAKVEVYLKQSNALADVWHRPITAEQLQAEMDRMTRNTRDPRVLDEIFGALGRDPSLIAETLARQTLVDRLVRNSYAYDARFHGELKSKAEAAIARCENSDGANLKEMGGEYREATWRPDDGGTPVATRETDGRLDPEEWASFLDRMAARTGGGAGVESDLGEDSHGISRPNASPCP